jgi:hypothetical protein
MNDNRRISTANPEPEHEVVVDDDYVDWKNLTIFPHEQVNHHQPLQSSGQIPMIGSCSSYSSENFTAIPALELPLFASPFPETNITIPISKAQIPLASLPPSSTASPQYLPQQQDDLARPQLLGPWRAPNWDETFAVAAVAATESTPSPASTPTILKRAPYLSPPPDHPLPTSKALETPTECAPTSPSGSSTPAPTFPAGNTHEARCHGYVSKNFRLPETRGYKLAEHTLQRAPSPRLCLFCRYMKRISEDSPLATMAREHPQGPKDGRVRRTSFQCGYCRRPLCKEFCFKAFHDADL